MPPYTQGQTLQEHHQQILLLQFKLEQFDTNGCQMTTPRRKLSPFEKKLKPGDETWTCFDKDSERSNWKIMHFAKLGLSDMGDIVKLGYYSVLEIVNGDFSRSHYSLHKKKNLKLLFALLKAHIKTNDSINFVKMRHADMEES